MMKSWSVCAALVLATVGVSSVVRGEFTTAVAGQGLSSTDGNVNKTPFDIVETDNANGSKSLVGSGFEQRQTVGAGATINAFAGGEGTAFASGGTVKVKVQTSAYTSIPLLYAPRVTANFGASFVDTVTLTVPTGSGLNVGDPVSYQVRWVLDGVTNSPYYYSGYHYPLGTISAYFSVYSGAEFKAGTGFNLPPYEGYTIASVYAIDVPYVVSGVVGEELRVSASLGLGADNRSGSILDGSATGYGDQSTVMDFSNTMHVYLDPVTVGLGFSAESLHNYASNAGPDGPGGPGNGVPEPATVGIVGVGMVFLLGRRRR